jgi:hypothetical protein
MEIERHLKNCLSRSKSFSILDGFVKSPTAALRFIFRHCGVLISTPHSSRFASLAFGAFYFAVPFPSFYESINTKCSDS